MNTNYREEQRKFDCMRERLIQEAVRDNCCSRNKAMETVDNCLKLIDFMRRNRANFSYYRQQDRALIRVTGTLVTYQEDFGQTFDIRSFRGTVPYWDVNLQAWRVFQARNLIRWDAVPHTNNVLK